jgi:predicted NAD/FAD-binding protein
MRVAVIGAGIAGMGAAWALHRSGAEVSLFERAPRLGGNAKTWRWSGGPIETGLSVVAWPERYFHNYGALLAELGIETEPAPPIRFFVRDGHDVFAHGGDPGRFARDLERWERLVDRIRRVNRLHGGGTSLYDVSPLNPLAYVSLRRLVRLSGISDRFWEVVFVAVHSSSFLTVELDSLPAVIAPVLEDIVSLRHGGSLRTWSGCSREVFERMTRGFERRVHLGVEVRSIRRGPGGIEVRSIERGDDGGDITADAGPTERFDTVVLACPAPAALAMLDAPDRRERLLLDVRYADDLDRTFLRGDIHRDAGVLPAAHRDALLAGYANYVELDRRGARPRYENTFILSSWIPAARGADRPMLVSYNREVASREGDVSNRLAHPALTPANLARAALLHRIQGRRRAWFASSYTTPGNGHDLSFLSGLVIAEALGAPYPFGHLAAARGDFARLRRFMLRPRAASGLEEPRSTPDGEPSQP